MNYYNSETLLEQQQEIEKLKEQNAALAATVEALRDAYAAYVESGFNEILEDSFAATPQHHLAEVRAQAIQDFIQFMYSQDNCQLCNSSLDIASKYAESIRQENRL